MAIVLVSCISETPGTRTTCPTGSLRTVRQQLAVDNAFSPPERADIQQAVDDWFAFSEGHIGFTLTYNIDPKVDQGHIFRVESWMKVVLDEEAEMAKKHGVPEFHLAGWEDDGDIYLIVDRAGPLLKHLATHELGHEAGLKWPNCQKPSWECVHSPDPKALTAATLSDTVLGEADKEFCRASCLCP
jgi:hypothetical protein